VGIQVLVAVPAAASENADPEPEPEPAVELDPEVGERAVGDSTAAGDVAPLPLRLPALCFNAAVEPADSGAEADEEEVGTAVGRGAVADSGGGEP
jgi:hypothetical protein